MTDDRFETGWSADTERHLAGPPIRPPRPPWDPSMSDGCTTIFGRAIQTVWPAALICCYAHDEAYWRGGDELARRIADVAFWL